MDAKAAKDSADRDDGDLFQKLRPGKGSPRDEQKPQAPLEKGDSGTEDGGGGEEKSVPGTKLIKVTNKKDPEMPNGSQEDHAPEAELNLILKRSPSTYLSRISLLLS